MDKNPEFLPNYTFKLVGKNLKYGARAPWLSILVLLLTIQLCVKMLKQTETEETIDFVVIIFIISGISIGGGGGPPVPLIKPTITKVGVNANLI